MSHSNAWRTSALPALCVLPAGIAGPGSSTGPATAGHGDSICVGIAIRCCPHPVYPGQAPEYVCVVRPGSAPGAAADAVRATGEMERAAPGPVNACPCGGNEFRTGIEDLRLPADIFLRRPR